VAGTAVAESGIVSATGYVWRQTGPDADLATRVEDTVQNVETLKTWLERTDKESRDGLAQVHAVMAEQVSAIRADLDKQTTEDRRITSRAIRAQVIGLVVALVGALLSTVASLG
jgi:hypothetical protein